MWLSALPGAAEELRQGDLLRGLVMPKLQLPMRYLREADRAAPAAGDPIQLASQARDYVVVSQCCTIENSGAIALAPVRSTPPLKSEDFAAYEATEPSSDDDSEYAVSAFKLEPLASVVDVPSGRLLVADLTNIQSFEGERSELRNARVAAMTPAGRRLLRIKLSFFWGRAEAEDLAWFESEGLPAGLTSD